MESLILGSSDIIRVVRHVGLDRLMDEAIDAIEHVCMHYDPVRHQVPARAGFAYNDPHPGLLEWMPAMQLNDKVVVKLVGYHPHNPGTHRLPTILSTVLSFDTASGHLLSVTDGTFLTSLRTGAASAVASKVLALPDSKVVGFVGCGAQAITQLHALSRAFEIERILLFDLDRSVSDSFKSRTAAMGLEHLPFEILNMQEVVGRAEILCTATSISTGRGPLFEIDNTRSNVHVNAIGSDFPGKTELPLSLLENSLVCPDFTDQALVEGECQQLSVDSIGPDLVTLIKEAGSYHRYRQAKTVFDSTGWALEDYVVSEVLVNFAREYECGSSVALECNSADPGNPYGFLQDNAVDRTKDEPGLAAATQSLKRTRLG